MKTENAGGFSTDLRRRLRPAAIRYGAALGLVLAAFLIHYAFRSVLGGRLAFLAFLPATLLAAWFGGLGPGLASLAAGFLLGDFFFLPPVMDFIPAGPAEFASLVLYFFTGLLGIGVIERAHRVREKLESAEAHRRILEREIRERQRVEEALRDSDQDLRKAQAELQRHAQELERRVAERTARLKESLQALEDVLYHVAHDLRAPVRAMHSFTELLVENYGPHFDAAGQGYARRVEEACRKMDALILDLLEYGRLGFQKIASRAVDLQQTMGRLLAEFDPAIQSQQAQMQVDALPAVLADPAILDRILANLLANALKFVRPGEAPRIHIWAESRGEIVRLYIGDQGIGIPGDYQQKIFGVFERLHGSQTYPGTGIGLAIVKRGMERLGGRVGVESQPEKGARFWLELPRAPAAESAPAAAVACGNDEAQGSAFN